MIVKVEGPEAKLTVSEDESLSGSVRSVWRDTVPQRVWKYRGVSSGGTDLDCSRRTGGYRDILGIWAQMASRKESEIAHLRPGDIR
jgi:hypothetical protein